MKENSAIRNKMMRNGIRQWQCAAEIGVSEQTLVRWLRFPLSREREEKILAAIDRLVRGDG